MSSTQLFSNRGLDIINQLRRQFLTRLHQTEQHNGFIHIPWSSLSHADGIPQLGEPILQNAIDLCRTESHTRWIQHAIGSAEEREALGHGMVHDEIAVRPDIVVFLKVGAEVPLAVLVAPEIHRHVGEGLGGDQFSWCAVRYGLALDPAAPFNQGIVHLNLQS